MGRYDDQELTGWEIAYSNALAERLEKLGCSGLNWDEVPGDLMKEAEDAALEEVGPNPDADDE